MGWASSHGKPAVGPFLSISTIFYGTNAPLHNPTSVAVGVVMHLALSLLFGMIIALAVPFLRRCGCSRSTPRSTGSCSG